MKRKKELIVILSSLLVIVLSVSVAYFTAQLIGTGKEVSVTSANLQVIFEDTGGAISSTDIEPGWTSTKTFTIKNSTKSEYKYNIVLKDLVNTFVTEGYLQYKITSTNSGYNMTEFKDVPKSSTATDTILAYNVSVPVGTTQTYTIDFKYSNDENVDQSKDMGKELSGTLFITEGSYKTITYDDGTLGKQLLADKSSRAGERTDFSAVLTTNNTKTLYTEIEDNTYVYYFAGNATDNWVKFGKNSSGADLYWRIIRTNADGSIRLLYHSTSPTAEDSYIGESSFNDSSNSPKYVGYMYGNTDATLDEARTNTNESTIKSIIDTWYENNLKTNYGKYLSTTAVYCNDRELAKGSTYKIAYNNLKNKNKLLAFLYKSETKNIVSASGPEITEKSNVFSYLSYTRLYTNKTPTYDCTNINDKFTVSTSTGNGNLKYPIALITADEISFAGGLIDIEAEAYYYRNSSSTSTSSTGEIDWYTMSPFYWNGSSSFLFYVYGSRKSGRLNDLHANVPYGVRPVTSLKSCVKWKSGDGSASNPYEIVENGGC